MEIKDFIKKGIDGGYTGIKEYPKKHEDWLGFYQALLDPSFWSAVGKEMGKGVYCIQCDSYVPLWGQCECDEEENEPNPVKWGTYHMHQMIDHLVDGGTIENYIKSL